VFQGKESVYDAINVNRKKLDLNAEKKNTLDVLFIGDSACYSSFYPIQLWHEQGYTSLCLGTSSQRLCDTYIILKEAFKVQEPKVIIIEANCLYRSVKGGSGQEDKVLDLLTDNVPVFRFHNKWKTFAYGLKVKFKANDFDSSKGFKVRKNVKPYDGGEYMIKTSECLEFPKENYDYLEDIIKLCRKNNSTVLLVSTVSAVCWNYEKHNAVEQLANNIGCDYVDLNLMNEQVQIDWRTDTRDKGDHLNYFGAVKVSNFMSQYLEDTNLLLDHRNDVVYNHWYAAWLNYEKRKSREIKADFYLRWSLLGYFWLEKSSVDRIELFERIICC
jgi:hypothetical protein